MNKEKSRRDFIARQEEFLVGKGKSTEEIRSILGNELPSQDVAELLDAAKSHATENIVLAALQKHASEIGLSRVEVTRRYTSMVQDLQVMTRAAWATMRSLKSQVTLTAAIALIVISIFLIFVIPQFEALFTSFGAELPTLTLLVIRSASFGALLIGIPILAFAWVVAEELYSRKILSHRAIPPKLFWEYSLLGPVMRQHFELIHLWLVQLLLESNKPPERALTVAETVFRDIGPYLASEVGDGEASSELLALSGRIGTLEEELKFRIDRLLIDLPATAAVRRERLTLLFGLVIGVIVGILIIAMYLPIFKLGSVV